VELDAAALNAAIGLLENTAPPGTTLQKAQEDLVEAAKDLANGVKVLADIFSNENSINTTLSMLKQTKTNFLFRMLLPRRSHHRRSLEVRPRQRVLRFPNWLT
jgi:hypothetical protein